MSSIDSLRARRGTRIFAVLLVMSLAVVSAGVAAASAEAAKPAPTAVAAAVAPVAPVAPAAAPAATAGSVRGDAGLPARIAALDATVARVQQTFNVPGIAIAIVKDGQVVLERGYGPRRLDGGPPIDARTLFAIASNTKAFTAAGLSILADEGKLDMDARVVDVLPWFQMSDPYVTREIRVRDLLAHRSGLSLGAGDLLYWPTTTYSGREVSERLRNVPLNGSFRAGYAYDNILFGVAQQVIEAVSGQSYKDFLQQRFFDPIGMADTRFNSDTLQPGDNVATGYAATADGALEPAPLLSWGNVSGAGGVYSSAHDMAKWLQLQLNQGALPDGRVIFSPKRQQEMWTVLTPMPNPAPAVPALAPARPNFIGYGEGWQLSDYRGQKVVSHTGGWPGMVSRVTLVPGQRLGMVVLTSQEIGQAFQAVTMEILDGYLDEALGAPVAGSTDWVDAYGQARAKAVADAASAVGKLDSARDRKSRPSLPLADYAKTYADRWYGDIVVTKEANGLVMRFAHTPLLVGDMEHWQHDTFAVRWRDRTLNGDAFVTFALNPDGTVRDARMQAISPLTDFSYDFQDLVLVPKTR